MGKSHLVVSNFLFFCLMTTSQIEAAQCPKDVTMEQLRELEEGHSLSYSGLQLKAASRKNIRDILPSTWSPTSYTAVAHLRNEYEEGHTLICEYGFKSTMGTTMSKFQFWKNKEDLNKELDYRFALYYNPHEDDEPVVVDHRQHTITNHPSGGLQESIQSHSEEFHPKSIITQEDIHKNNHLKELLTTLELANNPKISWNIVQIQYNLLNNWKTGEQRERIHQAFQELAPYFGH